MSWQPTRRRALAAVATLAAGSVAGCTPDPRTSTGTPTPVPTATATKGDEVTPGEVSSRDPLAKLQWGAPLQLAPDGQVVAALGFGEVIFWDTSTGDISSRVSLPVEISEASSSEPWSWMGGAIAVKSRWNTATAHLVDAITGAHIAEVRTEEGGGIGVPWRLALNPDASVLIVALGDGALAVHATSDGTQTRRIQAEDAGLTPSSSHALAPSFTPDGALTLSSHLEQCPVQFWSGDGSRLLRVVSEISVPYHHFQLTPDGGHCSVLRDTVQGAREAIVELRDGTSFELLRSHPLPSAASHVALHPAGTHMAWCGGAGNTAEKSVIHVMDLSTSTVTQLSAHEIPPRTLVYTPDGATLLSMDSHAGIHAFDHVTGTLRQVFEAP